MKTFRRKILIILGFSFIFAPFIFGFVSSKLDKIEKRTRTAVKRQWLILKGELVSVGDYRLHIVCQGAGSPTVMMDAGLNMTMQTWEKVTPEIAKFTRVCVYERAGLGESDKSTKSPRTSETIIGELQTLLQNAGENAPFILVGHSFGGINMRLYASRYPQSVAGLVLIDSSHEDEYERYAALKNPKEREEYLRHEGSENFEGVNLLKSAVEIRNAPPLPKIPLVVLSAENFALPTDLNLKKTHDEMQSALAQLTPDGKLIAVPNSGHFIQLDQPEAVNSAIRGVFETAKKSLN